MLSTPVDELCSLLKVQGSKQRRQRSSSPRWLSSRRCCWLLIKLRGSGEAELLGLLHILFGVSAGGGDAQRELVQPRPIPPDSPAPLSRLVAPVLLMLTAGGGGEGK